MTPRTKPLVAPPAVFPVVLVPVLTGTVVAEDAAGLGLELPVCTDTDAPTAPGRLTESSEPRPDEAEPD
ncbi:MAG: hypothetical protein ACRDPY_13120 [Streptosporangiaceae bacterium]